GRGLAEWIVGGHMPMDLWSVDPRRFAAFHGDPGFLAERMREVPGLHYRMAWPLREHETARGLLRSALHDRLAARGASFGARMGWERANWFAGESARPAARYPFARPDWLSRVARDTFFVVTSSGQRVRDADWIHRNLPRGANVTVTDVTEEFATLSLMGPRSREALARVTRADLSNAAFPYGSVRDIDIAGVT